MKKGMIILILFLAVIAVVAENVSITGTVYKNNGTALAGAELRLKKFPDIIAKSDANGAFELKGTVPISSTPVIPAHAIKIFVRGKQIIFSSPVLKSKAHVAIINSQGKQLYSAQVSGSPSGNYIVPLSDLATAQGLYLIKINHASYVYILKMIMAGSLYHCSTTGAVNQSQPAATGKTNRYAVIDTVIVCAPGYQNKPKDIESYTQQGVKCSLSVSNPWKPTGALEHSKEMVKIIALGHNFEMGQPDPNIGGDGQTNREQPVHTVSFTYNFWMDTIEVSQGDFDTVMTVAYTNYFPPTWDEQHGQGDSVSCYCVSWGDAALYCNARSKRDGYDTVYSYDSIASSPGCFAELFGLKVSFAKNGYRLPTEAEWEYACRAGSSTDFYWGMDFDPYPATSADTAEIGTYTVWEVNSLNSTDRYGVNPGGRKKANAYGLYDMSGNVSEWCNDYDASYTWGPKTDPTGPATGSYQILRGGNWGNNASFLRSANRYFMFPDYMYYFLGFRVVRRAQ